MEIFEVKIIDISSRPEAGQLRDRYVVRRQEMAENCYGMQDGKQQ